MFIALQDGIASLDQDQNVEEVSSSSSSLIAYPNVNKANDLCHFSRILLLISAKCSFSLIFSKVQHPFVVQISILSPFCYSLENVCLDLSKTSFISKVLRAVARLSIRYSNVTQRSDSLKLNSLDYINFIVLLI